MFTVRDSQYVPITDYQYGWRWTSDDHAHIPADDLDRIRPLSTDQAGLAWEYSKFFQGENYTDRFDEKDGYDVDGRGSPEFDDMARDWLLQVLPAGTETVFISWSENMAIETDVEIFIRYWDTFCYPVEDVVIWGREEKWVLLFDYKQRFYFAVDKNND